MQKVISRAEMRGKKLDGDCKNAKISKNECGIDDNRCFCYGLRDYSTEEYFEKCYKCGAFVNNAKPLRAYPGDEKELFMEREYGDFEACLKKNRRADNGK